MLTRFRRMACQPLCYRFSPASRYFAATGWRRCRRRLLIFFLRFSIEALRQLMIGLRCISRLLVIFTDGEHADAADIDS